MKKNYSKLPLRKGVGVVVVVVVVVAVAVVVVVAVVVAVPPRRSLLSPWNLPRICLEYP